MYQAHVPLIRDYSLDSADNLSDMLTFVLATIQQGLSTVPGIISDIRDKGENSPFLFGSKREGYRYIQDNKADLYARACDLFDPVQAVSLFFQIPGLGAVKAGFAAQLLGHATGCIDSHNLIRHGIATNTVIIRKSVKPDTLSRRLHDYVDLTHRLGGAEYLWDSWCDYVAGKQAGL